MSSDTNLKSRHNDIFPSIPIRGKAQSHAQEQEAFDTLVTLITSGQQEDINTLRQEFTALNNDQVWIKKIAPLLPDIIEQHGESTVLSSIMAPIVTKSIHKSIQDDPEVIAETLIPSVEISVRRIVRNMFADVIERINRNLDSALNLRWRIEAWRTGRPFAEVALSYSLNYRVEQIYLIERESGLLLQQVTHPELVSEDGDMVSSMLAAINDFVRDSFQVSEETSINTLSMGELNLVIEQGRYSYIAAVVRGYAPQDFDDQLRDIQNNIEYRYRKILKNYNGDNSGLEESESVLAKGLIENYREASNKPNIALQVISFILCGLLLLTMGYQGYRSWQWHTLVHDLHTADTLIVTRAKRRIFRDSQLEGFYAASLTSSFNDSNTSISPEQIIAQSAYVNFHFHQPESLSSRWYAYVNEDQNVAQQQRQQTIFNENLQGLRNDLEAELNEQQLTQQLSALAAPDNVELSTRNNNLIVTGISLPAQISWLEHVSESIHLIPQIDHIQLSETVYDTTAFIENIEQEYIFFAPNQVLASGDSNVIAEQYTTLRRGIRAIVKTQEFTQRPVRLYIISQRGAYDNTTDIDNLLTGRANAIQDILISEDIPRTMLEVVTENNPITADILQARGARAAPPTPTLSNGNASKNLIDDRASLGHVHIEIEVEP